MIRWLDGVSTQDALARERHGSIDLPSIAISREDLVTGDIRTLVIRWPAMATVVMIGALLVLLASRLP